MTGTETGREQLTGHEDGCSQAFAEKIDIKQSLNDVLLFIFAFTSFLVLFFF